MLLYFRPEKERLIIKYVEVDKQQSLVDSLKYLIWYNECVINIMVTEDFCKYPKPCPAGYPTVGFGHKIRPGDRFHYPLAIRTGLDTLRADFQHAINYAKEIGYERNDNRQLAVAHFIYCLGYADIRRVIRRGFMLHALSYTHFKDKKTGKYVNSKYLLKSRLFETKMYKINF